MEQTLLQMHNNNTTPTSPQNKEIPTWNPNRAYIQLTPNIVIDSCFPGGNIATATLVPATLLTIQIEGNTDVSLDAASKYWLYFRIRGFRKDKSVKFILKNANHLRKYVGQLRIKPYMVFKEQGEDNWQSLLNPIELYYTENAQIQGVFTFTSEKYSKDKKSNQSANDLHQHRDEKLTANTSAQQSKERTSFYFAMYYPYTYEDLSNFIFSLKMHHQVNEHSQLTTQKIYFNEQTITYSFERRKISLITITSTKNIQSFAQRQPCISDEIFPNPKDRPLKLKNCPVVLLTARVHPSETSSSYFIEGIINFLLSDSKASSILRQLFIFQIIPMLNPDGVQHGNFRFDHQLRNLNRYYGQASIEKTPSIRSAEILINYYRNKNNEQTRFTQFYQQTYCRLFLYADVHGHSSALPSFIYGNHTDKLEHMIENKTFCKILQQNFLPNGFSKTQSQFSKKNMTIQQRYDQFSKLCSGRVFAGRSDTNQHHVFHSYTIEVLPYWQQFSRKKNQAKGEKINAMDYARTLGKAFAITILDILDVNPQSKLNDLELNKLRRQIQKQCTNQQSRKLLTFKKIETIQSSASETSKKNYIEKLPTYLKEYVQRWFSNQIYVKHLSNNHQLLKQPKLAAFFQKISQNNKSGFSQLTQSPRKIKTNNSKVVTQPKETIRTTITNTLVPREKMIFVCRKQRGKVEGKINKQTLELHNDFIDLLAGNKNMGNKQIDFLTYKKESIHRREDMGSTQRYQKELINKLNRQQKKVGFQIKCKQIIPKYKNNTNSRIQTQTVISQTNESPIMINRNFSKKQREKSTPNRQIGYPNPRPSFIEQFMLKIREQRQTANVFLQKYEDEPKYKQVKSKPSIKQQVQQQQKKMLPILRRNKIFTVASQQKTTTSNCVFGRIYDSIVPTKKRAIEIQTLIDQAAILHTKKVFISQKKDQIIREQFKKSQKANEYKN